MNAYPIPDETWIVKFSSLSSDIIADARAMNLVLSGVDNNGDINKLQCSDVTLNEERRNYIRNVVFPLLFVYIYIQWFSLDRPRAALEDLVLDFRDVPIVYDNDIDLLGNVAGIAESSHESNYEQLAKGIKFHNGLYPAVEKFLEKMLSMS